MNKEEEWMLVTKEHVLIYHGITDYNWAQEHLIAHVVGTQDHKHFTVDLKVSSRAG